MVGGSHFLDLWKFILFIIIILDTTEYNYSNCFKANDDFFKRMEFDESSLRVLQTSTTADITYSQLHQTNDHHLYSFIL